MSHACRVAAAVLVLALAAALSVPPPAAAASLPFGQAMAQGHELPRPFGVGITYYTQGQKYGLDRLEFSLAGVPPVSGAQIGIENRLREANVQFDVWLLPYLNLFAMVGNLDGRTDVDLSKINIGLPVSLGTLAVDYDGTQYGGGLTLAAGGEAWFASVTAVTTTADLNGDFDSSVDATVVMPRFGLGNSRGSVWLGAMWQKTDEHHKGVIGLPYVGSVPFAVELSQKNDWNGLVGIHSGLGEHWTLELEGGYGSRRSASMTLAYRF